MEISDIHNIKQAEALAPAAHDLEFFPPRSIYFFFKYNLKSNQDFYLVGNIMLQKQDVKNEVIIF